MERKYSAGWRMDSRWLEEERTYGRKWSKKESKYAPMHVLIVLLMEGNEWRKKITKAVLAWKKERFNGYLDGMKTIFRKESPDDAGLTWMIEALRAGELSSHVGRVLERKVRKWEDGEFLRERWTTSRTILGTLSARIRESYAFEEARTTSCTILGTLSAYIRREGDTKREGDQ